MLALRRVTPELRLGGEFVVEAHNMRRDRLDTRLNAGFKLKLAYEIKW